VSAATVDVGAQFDELFAQLDTSAGFGHREHVHLTWLAIRRYGDAHAETLLCHGIRRAAEYANAPQKYHVTVSVAWVRLIAHHLTDTTTADFAEFIESHPALLDKRLLLQYYRSSTLASVAARTQWVAPDVSPLPS